METERKTERFLFVVGGHFASLGQTFFIETPLPMSGLLLEVDHRIQLEDRDISLSIMFAFQATRTPSSSSVEFFYGDYSVPIRGGIAVLFDSRMPHGFSCPPSWAENPEIFWTMRFVNRR